MAALLVIGYAASHRLMVFCRPIDATEPYCVGTNGSIINCGITWLTGDDAKAAQVNIVLCIRFPAGALYACSQYAVCQ